MSKNMLLFGFLCFIFVFSAFLSSCHDDAEGGYASVAPPEDGDESTDDDDDDDDSSDDDDDDNNDDYSNMDLEKGSILGSFSIPLPTDDSLNLAEVQLYLLNEEPVDGSLPTPIDHLTLQNPDTSDNTKKVFAFEFQYLADGIYYLYSWIDLDSNNRVNDNELFWLESPITILEGVTTFGDGSEVLFEIQID